MRLMTRSITTAAVMYTMAVSHVSAQAARPIFTGTWILDASRSQASTTLPSAATWTLVQHGDTLVADRETSVEGMDAVKTHVVVGFDGKPWKNTVSQPGVGDIETSTVASWDNSVLVLTVSGNIQGTDFVQTDRWTLGADGKSLVSQRSVTVEGQEVQSATFTFAKKN
jgi:hypothetical protein